jgi:hypothetical protein
VVNLVQEPNEYFVDVSWEGGQAHRFSGFSWGYGGEGPQGLMTFLRALSLDEIADQVPTGKFRKPWRDASSVLDKQKVIITALFDGKAPVLTEMEF